MNLFSVPEYLYQHKCVNTLHCNYCKNFKLDKNKFSNKGNTKRDHTLLVYQCECGLSHAAHQKQNHIEIERKRRRLYGKWLGIGCSDLCLCIRHKLHEEMDIVLDTLKISKDEIYNKMANLLEVNIEMAHVGMLGISQCRKLINFFKEMLNEEY